MLASATHQHESAWISHGYASVPSLLDLPPTSHPILPSRLSQSPGSSSPSHIADPHCVSHSGVYVSMLLSPYSQTDHILFWDGMWDSGQQAVSICDWGSAIALNSGMHGVSLNSEVYSDNIIHRVKSQHLKAITHNLAEEFQYSVHKTTTLSFPLREWQVCLATVGRNEKTGMSPSISSTLTFRGTDVLSPKCPNYAQGYSSTIVSVFLMWLPHLFHLLAWKTI